MFFTIIFLNSCARDLYACARLYSVFVILGWGFGGGETRPQTKRVLCIYCLFLICYIFIVHSFVLFVFWEFYIFVKKVGGCSNIC
nr:MAG TPA: hypothetical protein [Microviridae sp.]